MKNLVTALSPHLMTAKRVTNRNDQVNHIGIFSYVVWTLSLAYFCETLNTVAGYLTTTLPKLTFAGDEAPYVSHVPWPRSPAVSLQSSLSVQQGSGDRLTAHKAVRSHLAW